MNVQQGPGKLVDLKVPVLLPQELAPAVRKGNKVKSLTRVPGFILQQWEDPLV